MAKEYDSMKPLPLPMLINTLRPRQNGRHFPDDIFLNQNVRIPINISLEFVPKGPVNNITALVQIMAWRRPGDKPLSETMLVSLLTHICVTRPQWVNQHWCPVAFTWGQLYSECSRYLSLMRVWKLLQLYLLGANSAAENAKSWVAQWTTYGWWLGGPSQFWVVRQSIISSEHEIN